MGSFDGGGEPLPEAWSSYEQLGETETAGGLEEPWLLGGAHDEMPVLHYANQEDPMFADYATDEKYGGAFVCGGDAVLVNPGDLVPDADGKIGDFSWWFNGTPQHTENPPTDQQLMALRPVRSGEAAAIIANQLGVDASTVSTALSFLNLKDTTALNRWHVKEDFGDPSYGQMVTAAVAALAEAPDEGQPAEDQDN